MRNPSKASIITEKAEEHENQVKSLPEPRGAVAMVGFAKRFRKTRQTKDLMIELREGETEVIPTPPPRP
jgi:hypothetical protein